MSPPSLKMPHHKPKSLVVSIKLSGKIHRRKSLKKLDTFRLNITDLAGMRKFNLYGRSKQEFLAAFSEKIPFVEVVWHQSIQSGTIRDDA